MNINVILAEFLNIGGSEMFLIVGAIVLLFGGKRLPELARGLGKGIREFKDATEGVKREIHRNINEVQVDTEDPVLKANEEIVQKKSMDQQIVDELNEKATEQAIKEN